MYDIRMGQNLISDFPLKSGKTNDGHNTYVIGKGEQKTDFDKELVGGVLVKRDYITGAWQVADRISLTGNSKHEENACYNDLKNNYGIWKDKGILFLKNNKIDENEVTPLKEVFNKYHKLGWIGADLFGAHLFGSVKSAWFEMVNGDPCLSLMTQVEQKNYRNYGSDGLDLCTELYIQESSAKDRKCLLGR